MSNCIRYCCADFLWFGRNGTGQNFSGLSWLISYRFGNIVSQSSCSRKWLLWYQCERVSCFLYNCTVHIVSDFLCLFLYHFTCVSCLRSNCAVHLLRCLKCSFRSHCAYFPFFIDLPSLFFVFLFLLHCFLFLILLHFSFLIDFFFHCPHHYSQCFHNFYILLLSFQVLDIQWTCSILIYRCIAFNLMWLEMVVVAQNTLLFFHIFFPFIFIISKFSILNLKLLILTVVDWLIYTNTIMNQHWLQIFWYSLFSYFVEIFKSP
jgi:hypothetical protein